MGTQPPDLVHQPAGTGLSKGTLYVAVRAVCARDVVIGMKDDFCTAVDYAAMR